MSDRHVPSGYDVMFIVSRMWSCLLCKRIFSGRELQCPHCLSSREPENFFDLA